MYSLFSFSSSLPTFLAASSSGSSIHDIFSLRNFEILNDHRCL